MISCSCSNSTFPAFHRTKEAGWARSVAGRNSRRAKVLQSTKVGMPACSGDRIMDDRALALRSWSMLKC